jgi:phosphatidylglycerol---prolipoprotein diacylglyceryl transferase
MIPYVTVPDIPLVPAHFIGGRWPVDAIAVHPFGLLVAVGVWVGIALTLRERRRRRMPLGAVQSYLIWLLVGGFVGGHVFELLFYCPRCLKTDPQLLLRLWDGQSSFGGFIGAGIGSLAWQFRSRVAALPYSEVVASSFPAAWFFGRMGCAVVHDHPGQLSSAWLAVAYPGGARLDMGLLEAAATLPLAAAFLWLRRKPRPSGLFLGSMCTYYAPLRFVLDFARARDLATSDARFLELTPAQWSCLGLFAVGLYLLAGAHARAAGTV